MFGLVFGRYCTCHLCLIHKSLHYISVWHLQYFCEQKHTLNSFWSTCCFYTKSCLPLLSRSNSMRLNATMWLGVCLYIHNLYFFVSGTCRHFILSICCKRKWQDNLFSICLPLEISFDVKGCKMCFKISSLILCIRLEYNYFFIDLYAKLVSSVL